MSEMARLHELLDGSGIEHEYVSFITPEGLKTDMGNQILVPDAEQFRKGKGYSVISHRYSYGGDKGLLEIWKPGTEAMGWLSAEEALKAISEGMGLGI